ncbi:MAG: DNA replication/repair protein RecF [Bacteroidota bacterium]|nr:DNA replication/repair protein RecF [Bacteroidota bacterium]
MFLKKLNLINFKNYPEAELSFSPKVNCFTGNNGMGKTNLLDAIYYLSFCKSYFNQIDSQNIRYDQGFFMVQGVYERNGETEELHCGVKRNQKKQFKRNKKEYDRLSEHIGLYPLVMISPSDNELIVGGSEYRRKFIDGIISQYDKIYLEKLIAYNHVLAQRNALLKHFGTTRTFDSVTLELWDDQLILHGDGILKKRLEFLQEFTPLFNKNFAFITDSTETVDLDYIPSIKDKDYRTALMTVLPKDRVMEYTTVGIHRDDMEFKLNGNSLKKFASQGQQKSYLLALKLAQFEFIKKVKNTSPLLLLDDVYDKLDEPRFRKLISLVSSNDFGQVFITDTHSERIHELFMEANVDVKMFHVENGVVEEIAHA